MTRHAPYNPPEPNTLPTGALWEIAKQERLWCVYKVESITGKDKLAKVPYGINGRKTGWNMHLGTFEEARQASKAQHADGVGYLPAPGSALVIVDFDNVLLDPTLTEQAHNWISKAGYWELSSSGTGYHAIIPRPEGDSEWTMDNAKGWMGYIGNRAKYVALTFNNVDGSAIEEIPGLVEALRAARAQQSAPDRSKALTPLSVREQWWLRLKPEDNRACFQDALDHIDLAPDGEDHGGARREVWVAVMTAIKASSSPYAEELFLEWSRSQPGYVNDEDVLRNWRDCAPDGRLSALTLFHYAKKQGFDVKAHERRAHPYDDAELAKRLSDVLGANGLPLVEAKEVPEPDALRAHSDAFWAEVERAEPPEFVLPYYLPRTVCSTLYARDGMGKSYLTLVICMHLAAGKDFAGLKIKEPMSVEFISVEDPREVILSRMKEIRKQYAFTQDEADLVSRNMQGIVSDFTAIPDVRLMAFDRDGDPDDTQFMRALMQRFDKTNPQLAVFDPISDVYGDDENVRNKVAAFMRRLNAMSVERNCATLLLGHPAKAAESDYSGSGAWSSKSRNRTYLEQHASTTSLLTWSHRKSSWGQLAPDMVLSRTILGCPVPLNQDQVDERVMEGQEEIRTLIVEIIRMLAGNDEVTSLAPSSPQNIGRRVAAMSKDAVDIRTVNQVANQMTAEGLLAVVNFDGSGNTPVIKALNRVAKKGLWPC